MNGATVTRPRKRKSPQVSKRFGTSIANGPRAFGCTKGSRNAPSITSKLLRSPEVRDRTYDVYHSTPIRCGLASGSSFVGRYPTVVSILRALDTPVLLKVSAPRDPEAPAAPQSGSTIN